MINIQKQVKQVGVKSVYKHIFQKKLGVSIAETGLLKDKAAINFAR